MTIPPEQREAAERVRRVNAGEEITVVYNEPWEEEARSRLGVDRIDLADAFLELCGEEGWDYEWLQTVGFEPTGYGDFVTRANTGDLLVFVDAGVEPWELMQDGCGVKIPAPATRSDVLLLLKALKIEVKNGKDQAP